MITIDDICPEIKSNNPIERAMAVCMSSDSKDPVKILRKLMSDPDIPFHGPVHHSLVPFAMLTAYKNSGGDIDLEDTIKTAHKRGSIIPAAVCGHWGSCGAALGCGIAFSIITGDGPLAKEIWSKNQVMVSRCLAEIAKYGGPTFVYATVRLLDYPLLDFVRYRGHKKRTRHVFSIDCLTNFQDAFHNRFLLCCW